MKNAEAKAVLQRLVDAMDAQLDGLRKQFGDKIQGHDNPTMVVMRTPEYDAIKHCLDLLGNQDEHSEDLQAGWAVLNRLHTFAEVNESSERAADALMRFLVGKCDHEFIFEEQCELCGTKQ